MPSPAARKHLTIVEPYAVNARLADLHLDYELVCEAVRRGDIDRRSVPIFGYEGHREYAAGSRALSTICELGGKTDGGWERKDYLKIPVAMSFDGRVAVHATAGSEGAGKVDGDPTNSSLKGPHSTRASSGQIVLVDEVPPDFFWLFTRRDPEGLWAELFRPLMDGSGYAFDYIERILFGNIDPGSAPLKKSLPEIPASPVVEIAAIRDAS